MTTDLIEVTRQHETKALCFKQKFDAQTSELEKEQPCWRCSMHHYDDCFKRRLQEEPHIFAEQKRHCIDEGNSDYISDEDWCLAMQVEDEDALVIDLGKEECL